MKTMGDASKSKILMRENLSASSILANKEVFFEHLSKTCAKGTIQLKEIGLIIVSKEL